MPLDLPEDTGGHPARLLEAVSVEEAAELTDWLRRTPAPEVDLSDCTHLHTAALQALLTARPVVVAPPQDAFLQRWVLPLLSPFPRPDAPTRSAPCTTS